MFPQHRWSPELNTLSGLRGGSSCLIPVKAFQRFHRIGSSFSNTCWLAWWNLLWGKLSQSQLQCCVSKVVLHTAFAPVSSRMCRSWCDRSASNADSTRRSEVSEASVDQNYSWYCSPPGDCAQQDQQSLQRFRWHPCQAVFEVWTSFRNHWSTFHTQSLARWRSLGSAEVYWLVRLLPWLMLDLMLVKAGCTSAPGVDKTEAV